MTWTVANFLIEIIAGIAGAHFAAVAANDYSFGRLCHSIVGAVAGGLSAGLFWVVTAGTSPANGVFSEPRLFEQIAAHSLAGATTGGILMLIVGFLKHSIDAHRASKL